MDGNHGTTGHSLAVLPGNTLDSNLNLALRSMQENGRALSPVTLPLIHTGVLALFPLMTLLCIQVSDEGPTELGD